MAIVQHRSKRKPSGGRYRSARKKRVYELGGRAVLTEIGELKKKVTRGYGGNKKERILRIEFANLIDKNGKCHKVKMKNVIENPANANFTRRNVLTKGCIVETEMGKMKITSRPGQEGTLNGVLI